MPRLPRKIETCACGDHSWTRLTHGFVVLFDPEFASVFALWCWSAKQSGRTFYASRSHYAVVNGEVCTVTIKMHQMILPANGKYVPDHVNGNGLDNRRSNIRVATISQNAMNQKTRGGLSTFRGVSKSGDYWRAVIGANGRQKYLGKFRTEIEAAQAYDVAARELHGEFAKLNFSSSIARAS